MNHICNDFHIQMNLIEISLLMDLIGVYKEGVK